MEQYGNSNNVLVIDQLSLRFGGVLALDNVSIEVKDREILAIIGPNGAGKTCVLNCINGFYRGEKGTITYHNRDITKLPPYKIAELKVGRTFQNIELYTGLTTLENLMASRHVLMKQSVLDDAIYIGKAHKEEIEHRIKVEEIIKFLELESIRMKVVGMLSYGQRKKVELGRALAMEPELLLLDEPMAGMNVEEKEDLARYIIDISMVRKIPMVLVEHDMGVVMDLAHKIVALDFGKVIAKGTPEEIKANEKVIAAYLGQA
jgi:branched-chain amino acid transport system ATP-binding protein